MTVQPKTVMVAEDEPLIRMLAVEMLAEAGFAVIENAHAREALAVLEAKAAGIRVLFTDIHMPGSMNGLELAHHVRSHWPWIGVLIASGNAMPTASEMPEGTRFLQKPYDPAHAVTHVRELAAA